MAGVRLVMVLSVVGLHLATLVHVASAQALECPDIQDQLTTRVTYCFNHALAQRLAPSPPPSPFSPPSAPATPGQEELSPPAPTDLLPPAPGSKESDGDVLQRCFSTAGQAVRVLTGLLPVLARPYLQPLLNLFTQDTGLEFAVSWRQFAEIAPEIKFAALQGAGVTTVNNVFVTSSENTAELNSVGLFVDLTTLINNDVYGRYGTIWQEIHPFFKNNYAIAGGKIATVPFSAYLPYMFWRTDVFRRYNLTKPETWEEVIEVARFLNRINWDPRVRNKTAVCFPKPLIRVMGQPNTGAYLLTSILGSMMQYQGKVQGLLFDPASMTPLVNNTAMARALELYAQLAKLMPDDAPDGKPFDPYYQGIMTSCALGFRWAEQFKLTAITAYVKGNLGVSIMPGSTRVWDRVNNVMVDCTVSLCHGSDAIVRQDPVTGDNVTRYVNRVSYPGLPGYCASINAFSSRGYQEASYQVLSYVGGALLGSTQYLTLPLSAFAPIMSKHLTLEPEALAIWPSSYNRSDLRAFLSATISIMAHPNTLTDLKMPSQDQLKIAMDDAARLVERGGERTIAAIMAEPSRRLSDIASHYEPGGLEAFKAVYWQGIGFLPPPPPPMPAASSLGDDQAVPPPPPPARTSRQDIGVAIGVSIPVGVSVIAVVVVAVLLRRRAKHRTLLGKVVPPGLGPLTTLLVTDIESSTSLWDALPQDVMESSVALHYAVLRRVAHVNGGYESATEGDSIILGFHDPLSATRAAVQAQAELLAADWPKGLLNHPLCAPKYAVPAASTQSSVPETLQAVGFAALPPFPLWNTGTLSSASPCLGEADGQPDAQQQGSKISWHNGRCSSDRGYRSYLSNTLRTILSSPAHAAVENGGDRAQLASTDSEPLAGKKSAGMAMDRSSSSVGEFVSSLVKLSEQSPPSSALLYRGLRVRIGIHTGLLEESSVITNVRTGRLQYAGTALAIATAVSSAGHGGMVLLSEDTFAQLDSASLATKGLLLASMGSVQLMDVDAPAELYQALTQQLAYRVCFNAHLRYSQQLSPSFLHAPHDRMTVCFINAVGLTALNAWSSTITQSSIQVYQRVAATQLERHGGYLVNSSAGMFAAVFKDPAHAIRWALCTLQQCLNADWDPALLEHELGEEVEVGHNATEAAETIRGFDVNQLLVEALNSTSGGHAGGPERHSSTAIMRVDRLGVSMTHQSLANGASSRHASTVVVKTITRKTVLFRGLRLKCAVDVGQAKASIEPSTGRVMYFGRVMNRCARVAAMAKTGQVWCTQDVWDLASPTINSYERLGMEAPQRHDPGSTSSQNAVTTPPAHAMETFNDWAVAGSMALGAPLEVELASEGRQRRTHSLPVRPPWMSVDDNMTALIPTENAGGTSPEITPLLEAAGDGLGTRRGCSATTRNVAFMGRSRLNRPEVGSLLPPEPYSSDLKRLLLPQHRVDSVSRMTPTQLSVTLHEGSTSVTPSYISTYAILPSSGGAEEARSPCTPVHLVAGVPLGHCKLRGIQESVGLVHCRFDDQSLVQVATPQSAPRARPGPVPHAFISGSQASGAIMGGRGSNALARASLQMKTAFGWATGRQTPFQATPTGAQFYYDSTMGVSAETCIEPEQPSGAPLPVAHWRPVRQQRRGSVDGIIPNGRADTGRSVWSTSGAKPTLKSHFSVPPTQKRTAEDVVAGMSS